MFTITKEEARHSILNAQGLSGANHFGKGPKGTLKSIQHLGYVQLDTLAVVARAHHHTLWNRNGSYNETHLAQLQQQGKVFEYWSHAASYLPMEDYRFSLPRKSHYQSGHSHWFSKNKKLMKYVLDRIKAEGPLQSKDFETDRKRGSWFDWKPAKIALEQLFMEGSLMVSSRKGFQKVYDLTERVVPEETNRELPSEEEYAEYLIISTVRALGMATLKDCTHLRSGMNAIVIKTIGRMVKSGALEEITIAGVKELYYRRPEKKSAQTLPGGDTTRLLSPFDNLIIRRERIKTIFDWNYALECYLPEAKRKFGYFCLPILHNGNFAGMIDPKADRASGTFYVRKMYVEKNTDHAKFMPQFMNELLRFAKFNQCPHVQFEKTVGLPIRRLIDKYA